MAEPPLPQPVITRKRRARFSLVWIVPIVAALVGALMLVRHVQETGPRITISFHNAEGLESGRTEVRYKEVVVGRVTKVALSPDRERVIASVALDKSVESLAVADTRFWVVRPRINTAGVSGLGTLFSGAYIGVDAGVSDEEQVHFTGLEVPPFVLRGEPGRIFTLVADDLGSLEVGSPVLYRRTRIGRVVGFELDPVHDTLGVRVFIDAPNDRLVTTQSRFWNASGIDVTLSASGFTVSTQSIASVLIGGVAFANPDGATAAPAAPPGYRFRMADSQSSALAPADGPPLRVRMVFNQSLRGMAAGAPVDLLGVEIGTVRSVSLQYDDRTHHLPAEVVADIYPARLGAVREQFKPPPGAKGKADPLFLKGLVEGGLRAQARTGNLLTGQLFVALDFVPKAPPETLDASAEVPTIPTVPGTLADVQAQIAAIVGRLGKVRFDEIGSELQSTLKNANAATLELQGTLAAAGGAIEQLSPEAKRTLTELQQTLASVQATLESAQTTLSTLDRNVTQSDSPLQRSTNRTLIELQRAAQSLRVLGDYLQRHPESLLRGKPADAPPEGSR
jgi:paraquat-inducible protein B